LVRGEVQARTYNYRPWQPKFVKKLTDEDANNIGKKHARYAICFALLMMLFGVASIILGATGLGDEIPFLLALSSVISFIFVIAVYAYIYSVSKKKDQQ
jgi:hypothetical protein